MARPQLLSAVAIGSRRYASAYFGEVFGAPREAATERISYNTEDAAHGVQISDSRTSEATDDNIVASASERASLRELQPRFAKRRRDLRQRYPLLQRQDAIGNGPVFGVFFGTCTDRPQPIFRSASQRGCV